MTTTADVSGSQGANRSVATQIRAIYDSYLFRKLLKALLTAAVAITLTFFLVRLLPSNPIELFIQDLMVQYSMPYQEARDQAAALFAIDLDQPLFLQYLDYVGGLLRGDMGTSILFVGIWLPLSRRIGKKLTWLIGLIVGMVGYVMVFNVSAGAITSS